ncbi:MAG: signal peptidase II [Mariprofundaceae bacterium]|nr:signal peptidase II [Mariprofundaceae bacterium]
MSYRVGMQLALLSVIVFLDQWTKYWIEHPSFTSFVVIDGFFNIIRAHNDGVAFSLFADWPDAWRVNFLVGMTSAIAVGVLAWWVQCLRQGHYFVSWILILVLAGALGNIWDRSQLGYVVDFLLFYIDWDGQFYAYPAFNVADSSICIGVFLLLIDSFRHRKEA